MLLWTLKSTVEKLWLTSASCETTETQKLRSPSAASFAFLYWANEVTITHRSTLLLHLWFGLLAIANEMGTGNQEKRLCSRYSSSVYQNLNPVLLFRDGKSVPLTIAVIWLYKKHLINRLHLSSTNFHFSLNINFISLIIRDRNATTGQRFSAKTKRKFH